MVRARMVHRPTVGPSRRIRGLAAASASVLLGGVLAAVLTGAAPALAAANVTVADWEMNEPPGASVMLDSGPNGIDGSIGSAVQTGYVYDGAIAYHWTSTQPNQPPPKPERLIQVPDNRLNPGTRDYAVTMRFRTTHSYGNIIQKGQSTTPGGYFKWEIPKGQLMCLFRSRDAAGNLLGQKSVKSPIDMPLNDGVWHTVRCEKTSDRVTMTIDGTVTVQSSKGTIGPIGNDFPLTIGGKLDCDQVKVTCDYFPGDIDWVRIEASSNVAADTDPPTVPGQPTGQSNSTGTITVNWPASTDASPPITYRVYRDGGSTAIGQTTTTTLTDTGLAPGSTHTYAVDAVDAVNNASAKSAWSDPITVRSGAVFSDDFSSGGFGNWSGVTRLTIDPSQGSLAPPSARGAPSGVSAFAYKTLPSTYTTACMSERVNVAALGGTGVDLLRLRTAGNGPIAKAFVNASGVLLVRSDYSGAQKSSNVAIGSGWHLIQLCGTVGSNSAWDLYRDGVKIVSGFTADTGTTPIGRIQIGDTANKTWTINVDDVLFDGS
jgi:hypothetical protein